MSTDKDQPETIIAQPVERRQDWAAPTAAPGSAVPLQWGDAPALDLRNLKPLAQAATQGEHGWWADKCLILLDRLERAEIDLGNAKYFADKLLESGATKAWSGELPEPAYLGGDEAFGDAVRGYTADQMRTAIGAALESAKQACQQKYSGNGGPPDDPHPDSVIHNGAVHDCIEAIRALNKLAPAGVEKVAAIPTPMLTWALRELLGALPERRDWFNPDAERELRAYVAGAAQVGAREAKLADLLNRIDDFREINPSNYHHEDVCDMNNWGIDVSLLAAEVAKSAPGMPPQSAPADVNYALDLGLSIQALPCIHPGTVPQLMTAYEAGHRHGLRQASDYVVAALEHRAAPQSAPTEPNSAPQSAVAVPQTTSVLQTWPERIWLQWGEETPEEFPGTSEAITWCDGPINGKGDIEYVRADLAIPGAGEAAAPTDAAGWVDADKAQPADNVEVVAIGPAFNNWAKGCYVSRAAYSMGVYYSEDGDELYQPKYWIALPDLRAPAAKSGQQGTEGPRDE